MTALADMLWLLAARTVDCDIESAQLRSVDWSWLIPPTALIVTYRGVDLIDRDLALAPA